MTGEREDVFVDLQLMDADAETGKTRVWFFDVGSALAWHNYTNDGGKDVEVLITAFA